MTRFIAEFSRSTNIAIDAPDRPLARAAAERYGRMNPLAGLLLTLREPPPYLRVTAEGVVEHLSYAGDNNGFVPMEPGAEPLEIPRQRVLTLVLVDLPDRPPVEVREIPADWTDEDVERYTNSRADWVTASVTYIEPIPEEATLT